MTIFDLVFSFESALLLGQSLLLISILLLRDDPFGIYRPLMLFFGANAVNQLASLAEPLVSLGAPSPLYLVTETLSIPAFLVLAPALWLYVRGLTTETPDHLKRRDFVHFVPSFIAVGIAATLLLAPLNVQETILGERDDRPTGLIVFLTVSLIVLMLTWATQVSFYVIAILRRIVRYRARLKDVFASTEGRELQWIIWLIVMLILSLLILIPDFLIELPTQLAPIPLVLDLALFWFIAVWGLRQKPGFASEMNLSSDATDEKPVQPSTEKYEKSALTEDDMLRIADRIETAMSRDTLYLDANLSLRILAKHISVTPNYVSQTLNGHIGKSFFDYINHWRIEHAKPLLITTEETVLNITYDVGFNSRSSFYKAFKHETGMTPTAYRNQGKATLQTENIA